MYLTLRNSERKIIVKYHYHVTYMHCLEQECMSSYLRNVCLYICVSVNVHMRQF